MIVLALWRRVRPEQAEVRERPQIRLDGSAEALVKIVGRIARCDLPTQGGLFGIGSVGRRRRARPV
ncbi:hypothetical protein [Nonomuraea sp. NPDC052265]|uniref:hypothetical protein n=1 Tax=Nonomuraea sp. NPDC052265 TaxID=3364374 RepID=UPI0037CB7799